MLSIITSTLWKLCLICVMTTAIVFCISTIITIIISTIDFQKKNKIKNDAIKDFMHLMDELEKSKLKDEVIDDGNDEEN